MNRFTFTIFNDPQDVVLTNLLSRALSSGITSVSSSSDYYIDITFGDGSEMNAWNANKYYAWLERGTFTLPDGKSYQWVDGRPSRKVMAKLYNALKNL